MDYEIDEELRQAEREYGDFLDDAVTDQGIYSDVVKLMIENQQNRIIVNINDLRRKNEIRANKLLSNCFEELGSFQRALKSHVASIDPSYAKSHEEFFIGFEGSFGAKHVTPRTLTSSYLGNMVCIEGIVVKCSLIRPKIVCSVHYCPATQKSMERRYSDMTSTNPIPSSGAYPTKDEENNPLETEFGLSTYKDHQTLTIQEMPEKAPAGQLPRAVDIVADDDLVDKCKPGDRVQIIGAYRCLPGKKAGHTTGIFRTIIIANNVRPLKKDVEVMFSASDVAKIRKFSRTKKVFDILARSLAPSIHGHEYIKKAVLCMLLGGTEKILANGSRLRGDINILLIGDPSTAKSQMLRYVLSTAPRAVTTTGRGTTGVGLTAAVTADDESGERRLEAGAMVLADRGVVCIDEFDKMSDIDRTAIHEVMEQGRVTVAKAGIHAKLNARCSVLAAANPVYGRYDQYKPPMENIGMQDSLLSRFDLLFIVLDEMEPENDRRISDHVLRIHRYRSPQEQDGDPLPISVGAEMLSTDDPNNENEDENKETPIWEENNKMLHGAKDTKRVLNIKFLKKYVQVAKILKPVLSRDAANCIAEEYAKLRSMDQENTSNVARTTPVTARTLETLIRLATAHAKSRLSRTISLKDAEVAIELVQFAYFKKVEERKKRKRADSDSEDELNEDTQQKRAKRSSRRSLTNPNDPYDFDSNEEDAPDITATGETLNATATTTGGDVTMGGDSMDTSITVTPSADTVTVTKERVAQFNTVVSAKFNEQRGVENLPLKEILDFASKRTNGGFSTQEANLCLAEMQDENKIMLADEMVFLI